MTIPENSRDILLGVVGSHAYGLATEHSDIDLRGVYLAPTESVLGIFPVQETIDKTEPDICVHELSKFIKLARQANPNILELLYLEDYKTLEKEGQWLIDIRQSFLSTRIRDTYGGYAIAQIKRLMNRNDGSFASNTRKRYAKHARHCFRLIDQGHELLTTGNLTVKVSDPDYLFWLGEQSPETLEKLFSKEFDKLDHSKSVLPDKPNDEEINDLVLEIRLKNLDQKD